MKRYRLSRLNVRLVPRSSDHAVFFEAPIDEVAVRAAENPPTPLGMVAPGGEAFDSINEIWELWDVTTDPPRLVKRWDTLQSMKYC